MSAETKEDLAARYTDALPGFEEVNDQDWGYVFNAFLAGYEARDNALCPACKQSRDWNAVWCNRCHKELYKNA